MYWRFYSLVGFVFLLVHCPVLADERASTRLTLNGDKGTEVVVPAPDYVRFSVAEPLRLNTENNGNERTELRTSIAATTLMNRVSPPSLVLPPLVRDLVGPWLPRLTGSDPPVLAFDKAPRHFTPSLWPTKSTPSLPRLDRVWQIVPIATSTQAHESLAIDGDVDLGLAVHAGTTKNDRATNAIKGTASSRFTLMPTRFLEERLGRYLGIIRNDNRMGHSSHGQVRLGFATTGAYALNPNMSVITPTGEVIGTLSWAPTMRDSFTHDPWRLVAFRWNPTVSCEGRSLMGEGKKQAEANRVPLQTLTGSLRGDLRLDFLSPLLAASGNYQYRQQLTDSRTKWEQASVSLQYQLNHHVSLGGSLTHGKTAPHQPTERGLALEMGVTF